MKSGYLFNSHALLAFFQNETGANIVYEILQKSRKEHIDRLVCVINLGEIVYITKRMFGDQKKLKYWAAFISLDLRCCLFPIPWFIRLPRLKQNIRYLTPTVLL